MITLARTISQKSSKTKILSVNLQEVNVLVREVMYENDLRSIPVEKTAEVAAALLYRTIKQITDHPKFTLGQVASDPVVYEPYYFHNHVTNDLDFEIVTLTTEYDTSLLCRYYTPETLEGVISDIQYVVMKEIYSVTPNAYFEHKVELTIPHTGFLVITINEDDLEEYNADDVSDGSDSGLHPEALLDRLFGPEPS